MKINISLNDLRKMINYDHETGYMTRVKDDKKHKSIKCNSGHIQKDGYLAIYVGGKTYLSHRLAWLYFHGELPKGVIDHIDGNKLNNSIVNLRDVDRSGNAQNQRRAQARNKCGLLGASFEKGANKWRSEIVVRGKRFNLGRYATAQLAHQAYVEAKRKLHSTCTI